MEIWKDIPGYEGRYQISNLGNVKSLNYNRSGKEKLLKPGDKGGYLFVNLYKNNKHKAFKNHKLVAQEFIPNYSNKKIINHKNGIKYDNRVENLERSTYSENNIHAYKMGLNKTTNKHHFKTNHPTKGKFGKDNINSKKVNQYTKQGEFIKTWDSMMDIERELNFFNTNISSCCKGKLKTTGGYKWKYFSEVLETGA